jgi:hypothetical protein
VIHANGYMCRESFSLGDRPENFYMIGSMGLASAIGLGFSLADRDTATVVLDGDGNLLMNLGILPRASPEALRPHCVRQRGLRVHGQSAIDHYRDSP